MKQKKKAKRGKAKNSKTVKPVKAKRGKTAKKPPETKTDNIRQTVIDHVKAGLVTPKDPNAPQLIQPLPQKEVRNFGEMPFDSQARLVFNTFAANEGEVIGSTENSGPGTTPIPSTGSK